MKPTLEQYLQGATTWKRFHKGVMYTLSHHGISDYSYEGIWCFYIHLTDEMFLKEESFARFYRKPEIREMSTGSYWETHDYHDVPDYGFHGGITWYSEDNYIGKFDGKPHKAIKIGCDYNHLWDHERNWPDDLETVDMDVKALIDKLVEAHPLKSKCDYCGKLDMPDQFYISRNGRTIHNSQKDQFSATHWPEWMPKESEAA